MVTNGGVRGFEVGDRIPGTRYRVVRQIGRGGMGIVYEVEQVELGRRFVLKTLLPEHTTRSDLVARIRQEWRALGQLRHPGIVDVTDAGATSGGVPFYVMELLFGETLRARLRRGRSVPTEEAITIAVEVLEALAAAHDLGIVHRDVKPGNIFLVGPGRVKLLDFGIAKLVAGDRTITARGATIGTPRYLSPEQALGEKVDGRADIYAVGLVLYEMLSGRGPFDGDRDPNTVLLARLTRSAPRLDEHLSGVEPDLVDLVARLLATRAHDRPQSARVVASALRRLLPEPSAVAAGDDEGETPDFLGPAPVGLGGAPVVCATEVIPAWGLPRGGASPQATTERVDIAALLAARPLAVSGPGDASSERLLPLDTEALGEDAGGGDALVHAVATAHEFTTVFEGSGDIADHPTRTAVRQDLPRAPAKAVASHESTTVLEGSGDIADHPTRAAMRQDLPRAPARAVAEGAGGSSPRSEARPMRRGGSVVLAILFGLSTLGLGWWLGWRAGARADDRPLPAVPHEPSVPAP
ncbi:MAG: serine/threonine protein kinase [Polyangiaceae bacterium]|nr:serine/threonine protein kinase [Polyangiaceae bacterium]